MKLLGFGKSLPSELNDPFNSSKIHAMHMHWNKPWREGLEGEWTASISFRNGNTRGEQHFEEADLGTLVQKMENFIQRL